MRARPFLRLLAVLVLLACAFASGAHAQGAGGVALDALGGETATPAPIDSPEAVRDMVARLSDAEVRALLLERLDAVARDEAGTPDDIEALGATLGDAARGFASSVSDAVMRAPNLPGAVGTALARFYQPRGLIGTLHLLAVLAAALALGRLAERALRRVMMPRWRALWEVEWEGARLGYQAAQLAERFLLELAEAAVFMAVAWLVIVALTPPEPMSGLILSFFLWGPVLWVRATALVTRFLFAKNRAGIRLANVNDRDAAFLRRSILIFAALVGLRDYALDFLGGHGVALAEARLGFWLTLVVYGWLIFVVWRARDALTDMLTGRKADVTETEAWVARIYPRVALVLVVVFWVLGEVFSGLQRWDLLLDGRLPLTLALLIFAPGLDVAIRGIVYHFTPPMTGRGALAEAADAASRRGLIRIGRLLAGLVLVAILGDLWEVDVSAAGAGFGTVFALRLGEALTLVAFGYLMCELTALWVNRKLSAEIGGPADDLDGGGEGGGSRLSTVLPLISRVVQAAIVAVTVLLSLGALGVNTTPLLAGAGILGLAVGFGAQKLVSDIVSGIFFLVDDAFRIGEYVEVDGTFGTVEQISVRSIQLRHHEGPVHTIPFGEIPKLTNYSRDWVIMKLPFHVPFDTDLDKVKKLFKQIGREMLADERFAEDFLQPFKSQGVMEVNDIGMVIRGKFMARPGRQWVLRKEIYQRVQQAFDANGIAFARREVHVQISGDAGRLTEEEGRALGAAAAQATIDAGEAAAEPGPASAARHGPPG